MHWRQGTEEEEAAWHAVPVVRMGRKMGLTWSSGGGNGRGKSGRGKGWTWREMAGVLGVKERGQANPEFDSLAEFKVVMLGRTGDKGCDDRNFSGGGGGSPGDLAQFARAQECQGIEAEQGRSGQAFCKSL